MDTHLQIIHTIKSSFVQYGDLMVLAIGEDELLPQRALLLPRLPHRLQSAPTKAITKGKSRDLLLRKAVAHVK